MKSLQCYLKKYMADRGWVNLLPDDIAKSIMIEGAELLEHFQWENLTVAEVKKDGNKLTEIRKELADVRRRLFVLSWRSRAKNIQPKS